MPPDTLQNLLVRIHEQGAIIQPDGDDPRAVAGLQNALSQGLVEDGSDAWEAHHRWKLTAKGRDRLGLPPEPLTGRWFVRQFERLVAGLSRDRP